MNVHIPETTTEVADVPAGSLPPIVILAGTRTGSTMLRSILAEDPAVLDCSEVLNPELNPYFPTYWNFVEARWINEGMPPTPPEGHEPEDREEQFAEYLAFLRETRPAQRALIDLKYRDFGAVDPVRRSPDETPPPLSALMAINAPIIHLGRANVLEQHCSQLLATSINQWTHTKERGEVRTKPAVAGRRLRVPIETLIDQLMRVTVRATLAEFWLGSYPRVLRLSYEQLLENGKLAMPVRRALEKVTGRPFQITGRAATAKAAPPLEEFIENLDEVRALLRNTPFAWCVR